VDELPSLAHLQSLIPAGSPVEKLAAASELAGRLRARGDELLDHYVDAARAGGTSWTEVGWALGTSKQAAQQRFAALAEPQPGASPFGLTGTAAVALSAAASQAMALGHHYVQPEHLVLGLLAQRQELGGEVLVKLGVTKKKARARVRERFGSSAQRPEGSLGISPQTKRLLEHARRIAKSMRHSCPRTEHILLAMTSPKLDSSAATLMSECGVSPDAVRRELIRVLAAEAPELAERIPDRPLLARIRARAR
jgi:hypothetical protein